jgi:TolA-binding protein
MAKRLLIAIFILIFSASLVFAGEVQQEKGWWKELKSKIEKITPTKRTFTTAVGGVRGAREEGSGKLYWKGVEEEGPSISDVELEKFQIAVDMALEDKNAEALAAFEDFMRLYPESTLKKDAEEAVDRLKAEQ